MHSKRTMYFWGFIFAALAFVLALSYSRFMRGDYRTGAIFLFLIAESIAIFYAGRIVERNHVSDQIWLSSLFDGEKQEPRKLEDSVLPENPIIEVEPNSQKDTLIAWDGFDVDAPEYPEELDIALQAWRAISREPGTGTVKSQLNSWVMKAYPSLPTAARERIVMVCNWDRTGGRPGAN